MIWSQGSLHSHMIEIIHRDACRAEQITWIACPLACRDNGLAVTEGAGYWSSHIASQLHRQESGWMTMFLSDDNYDIAKLGCNLDEFRAQIRALQQWIEPLKAAPLG